MALPTVSSTRSGLFFNLNPGGLPLISDGKTYTGNIWFVMTGGTDAVGYGRHPDAPFATVDYAIGQCTAAQGDVIVVMPGYTETITNTARWTVDISGISIVGLGNKQNRPVITFSTDTTADIDVNAANVTIRNIEFVGNIAALAAPIDVNAAGFTMEDCDFYVASATKDIDITVITDDTANDMTIRRCNFNYDTSNEETGVAVSAASTEVIRLVGADRAVIEDCYFAGNFATSIVNGITTKSMDIRISRNRMYNDQTANVAGAVDLVAGCTGVIDYNSGFHGYATDIATVIDPSSCAMIENYFSNVVTEAGGIVGTRST